MTVKDNILLGDCEEVINEPYKGFYVINIGSSYSCSILERKQGLPYGIYWVLKKNDFDSREKCDLKKVVPHIDNNTYIHLSNKVICIFVFLMCLKVVENSSLKMFIIRTKYIWKFQKFSKNIPQVLFCHGVCILKTELCLIHANLQKFGPFSKLLSFVILSVSCLTLILVFKLNRMLLSKFYNRIICDVTLLLFTASSLTSNSQLKYKYFLLWFLSRPYMECQSTIHLLTCLGSWSNTV